MKKVTTFWAGLASIIVLAGLLAGIGISRASESVSIPPELAVGDLQLVFGEGVDPKNLPAMVQETWAKSKALRAEALAARLTQAVAKKGKGPDQPTQDAPKFKKPEEWMAALEQKKWLPEANAFIRALVPDMLNGPHKDLDASTSWYCYFGPGGKYPDRLDPETVALLKEAMWKWTDNLLNPEGDRLKKLSQYLQGGKPYQLLPLDWGKAWSNENIEIRYKLPLYLVLDALRKDPAYAKKCLGDKTVEEWFVIFKAHMIALLRDRVMAGMWIEPGSSYAHVTYEQLVRLYNVAPDPEIRQMAKMVLDLVFLEEELLCVNGIRGGGRSRSGLPLPSKHAGIKKMVYGEETDDLRNSIEFELSDYQVPATAVVLHLSKGAVKPYVIYNRVPGEIIKTDSVKTDSVKDDSDQDDSDKVPSLPLFLRDSRLVNYVYRTPGYSLGCTLMNPNVTYHATSDQERRSSLLFQSGQWVQPTQKNIISKESSGRSGKAYWSIQHENVMLLQQFGDSERVEEMQVCFSSGLNIVEREGWIFAEAGSGYAAVRFINPAAGPTAAGYQWDADYKPRGNLPKDMRMAKPTGKYLPILFHAGDPEKDGTFEQFQKTVLEGKITIDPAKSRIDYQPKSGALITWFYNQNAKPIELALVNGQPPNLQPTLVYDSPFMKAKFGDKRVYIGAGPFRAVYDLEKLTVTESRQRDRKGLVKEDKTK